MDHSINILDFKDSDNKRYIFSRKNYNNHLNKHPELKILNFLDRIREAILNPYCIHPAFNQKETFCYYNLEFTIKSISRYTKVVVKKLKHGQYVILSAYRPTDIKELKYYKEGLTYRP